MTKLRKCKQNSIIRPGWSMSFKVIAGYMDFINLTLTVNAITYLQVQDHYE